MSGKNIWSQYIKYIIKQKLYRNKNKNIQIKNFDQKVILKKLD